LLLRARVSVSCTAPGALAGGAPVPICRGMPLQEVARRMKVRYERGAGPASTSAGTVARSITNPDRWPRRWRRGEKRDRRATWLRWRVPSDGGQWR
jgi:hypothetical protein